MKFLVKEISADKQYENYTPHNIAINILMNAMMNYLLNFMHEDKIDEAIEIIRDHMKHGCDLYRGKSDGR